MAADSLAEAYATLVAAGRKPTVRVLRDAAGVSTDAAAAFLRNVTSGSNVPEAPDLTEAVGIVWAVAWRAAYEAAATELAAELEAARAGESDALAAAETADGLRTDAWEQTERANEVADAARRNAATAQAEAARERARADALAAEVTELRANLAAVTSRADRAEATADALTRVLDALRPPTPTPAAPVSAAEVKIEEVERA